MTTNLITAFECAVSDAHTYEDLIALADHVLELVDVNTRAQYYMDSIGSSNAADIAFANESVCEEYFETHPLGSELILRNLPIKELAYHLVFTETDKATQLLNELLYYRTNGQMI